MTDSSEASGAAAGDAGPAGNSGPGALLWSARNARGLSRIEAAAALRLDESSVAALEEENFGRLGAPVYVLGHLRRYAEWLGLPAQTVLDAYRAADPLSETVPELARRSEVRVVRHSGAWSWSVSGGVLLLVAVLAWAGSRSYQAWSPAAAAHSVPSRPVTASQEAVSRPPAAASPVADVPAPDPVPAQLPSPLPRAQPDASAEAAAPQAAPSAGAAAAPAAPVAGDSRKSAHGG